MVVAGAGAVDHAIDQLAKTLLQSANATCERLALPEPSVFHWLGRAHPNGRYAFGAHCLVCRKCWLDERTCVPFDGDAQLLGNWDRTGVADATWRRNCAKPWQSYSWLTV